MKREYSITFCVEKKSLDFLKIENHVAHFPIGFGSVIKI
jgi:hypothetical protein